MDDYLLVCQKHPYLDDYYCIALYMYREADVTYTCNHPVSDDSVHPILDVAFFFHYWMLYVIMQFLDETYNNESNSV